MTAVMLLALLACGSERAAVKDLRDGFEPGPAQVYELKELVELTPPAKWTNSLKRQPLETKVVQVRARLVGIKIEADEDAHVVIADEAGRTMIVEFVPAHCTENEDAIQAFKDVLALLPFRATAKFRKLEKPIEVVVTGSLFFDRLHGQTGVAPNGVEIHPVLRIEVAQ